MYKTFITAGPLRTIKLRLKVVSTFTWLFQLLLQLFALSFWRALLIYLDKTESQSLPISVSGKPSIQAELDQTLCDLITKSIQNFQNLTDKKHIYHIQDEVPTPRIPI